MTYLARPRNQGTQAGVSLRLRGRPVNCPSWVAAHVNGLLGAPWLIFRECASPLTHASYASGRRSLSFGVISQAGTASVVLDPNSIIAASKFRRCYISRSHPSGVADVTDRLLRWRDKDPRISEIDIRIAVGIPPRDVMVQFLTEAPIVLRRRSDRHYAWHRRRPCPHAIW